MIVGVTNYYLNWLRIKESKLKIETLEQEKKEESSVIYLPTTEEVEIYSKKEHVSNLKKKSFIYTALILFMINVAGFIIYKPELVAIYDNYRNKSISAKLIPEKLKIGEITELHYDLPKVGVFSIWSLQNDDYTLIESDILNSRNSRGIYSILVTQPNSEIIIIWENTESANALPVNYRIVSSELFSKMYEKRGYERKQLELDLIIE